jgi:hypothetical protein
MWGFYNSRNRILARKIFQSISDKNIAINYNSVLNKKGLDQLFLDHFVYWLIYNDAIVHDSFSCRYLGGAPFPTRRVGLCHVGGRNAFECSNATSGNGFEKNFTTCPIECRPLKHINWTTC